MCLTISSKLCGLYRMHEVFFTGNYSCIFNIFRTPGPLNHTERDQITVLQQLPDSPSPLYLVQQNKSKTALRSKRGKLYGEACSGNPPEQPQ